MHTVLEETVTLTMPDALPCPVHVFSPGDGASHPGVIVYQDALGTRPASLDVGRRLAANGYVALAPDTFYRKGPYEPLDPKAVFSSPDGWAAIRPMTSTTSTVLAAQDSAEWIAYLRSRDDVAPGAIGVTGFCMGGLLAYRTAATYPDDIGAVATFHTARFITDDELSPAAVTPNIKARVLIAGADNDAGYPPEMNAELDRMLTEAGVDHVCEIYPGALHGWMMTDFPVYDEASAERGWSQMLALFGEALR
jgi:carboxymethylenebutenolidase